MVYKRIQIAQKEFKKWFHPKLGYGEFPFVAINWRVSEERHPSYTTLWKFKVISCDNFFHCSQCKILKFAFGWTLWNHMYKPMRMKNESWFHNNKTCKFILFILSSNAITTNNLFVDLCTMRCNGMFKELEEWNACTNMEAWICKVLCPI